MRALLNLELHQIAPMAPFAGVMLLVGLVPGFMAGNKAGRRA